VTPFSWSQPHDVNDHVDGLARALRARGHTVTVLAPSGRARDLLDGRRSLASDTDSELVCVGRAVSFAPGSQLGVPVGVRANLAAAIHSGRFDVVHGMEPALPSLSYLGLLDATTLTAATFFSSERLGFPTRKPQRERLLARIDALLATSSETADAAAQRFPGDYRVVTCGVDPTLFTPVTKRQLIVLESVPSRYAEGRAVLRALRTLPDWELVLARATRLAGRPTIPPGLRGRVHVRTVMNRDARAAVLAEAAIVVLAPGGSDRLRLEAQASGCAIVEAGELRETAELTAQRVVVLAGDQAERERAGSAALEAARPHSFADLAAEHEAVYSALTRRRRPTRRDADPLADREWITADLHMHTSWSGDCSTDAGDLLDHAEAEGLGAIAITDHNVFGGALEAVELARNRDLIVIPGEEIKTDSQGEVIGLFLHEEIPRGMTFADTAAAIREQGGLVYVPHPFDRMHAIPEPATLHRHLAEIDVLEVYNARLLRDSFNDEALRFARKYGLLAGAGSDAHVLQGVGTGALRMRRFDGPEEFLLSLRSAEVLRRPKSLAYLQSLKWVAQVKEKVR
jgi:predicted metal-dependent phosphoesterase TrpH